MVVFHDSFVFLLKKKENAMLIDFTLKNFLSYKDESSLLLTRINSYEELENFNVIDINRNFDLLKSIALFGSNGGGKSNLISAIAFMKDVVHNSFVESMKKDSERGKTDIYFKLNTDTLNKPSLFEVTFVKNEIIYRYGFEILKNQIVSEWLYKKVKTETLLFEREIDNFRINQNGFSEGNKYYKEVKNNVLFLSHLGQYKDTPVSYEIIEWFFNLNVISGLDDKHYKHATMSLLKESDSFKRWLSIATKFLDISNIELTDKDKLVTYHNIYDKNNIIVDSVSFDLELEESDGTKKLIYLLGAVYDSVRNGKVLFVDELNSKLHPNLTTKLLTLFHEFNKNRAQVIFTVHDPTVLDKEILRRDQVWFVDRDRYGVSELYPMSDFKSSEVRKTSDFRKKYLNSDFGAAESIYITNDLIDLMYE